MVQWTNMATKILDRAKAKETIAEEAALEVATVFDDE